MKRTLITLASVMGLSFAATAADAVKPDADNTRLNERDRAGRTATSVDQSNNPDDLKLAQSIRQAVVKDDSLTMTAKNVKIITSNGEVILRGPVNSSEEKMKIENL